MVLEGKNSLVKGMISFIMWVWEQVQLSYGPFDWVLSLHNSRQLINFPIGLTAPDE